MDNWRFLNTGAKNGFLNMAIDEVLATRTVPKDNWSIFRVYQWRPYAISLGYNQDPNDLDLERCHQDHIDVVRRPTGGRAVLHAEEITYSIIVPKNSDFYSKEILTTYNRINKGILQGLHLLGVKAELVEHTVSKKKKVQPGIVSRAFLNPLSLKSPIKGKNWLAVPSGATKMPSSSMDRSWWGIFISGWQIISRT